MNYKQKVIDYLEGKLEYEAFQKMLDTDPGLTEWLQSIAPEGMTCNTVPDKEKNYETNEVPYDIHLVLKTVLYYSPKGSIGYKLDLQDYIKHLISAAFPDHQVVLDPKPREVNRLMLDACPEYIGGKEVTDSGILERILAETSEDWSKTKKIKYIRDRIKEEFHIEGKAHPNWIQGPEWPVYNGRPMKYVKTIVKSKYEWYEHHFIDPETGEERIVNDVD